MKRRTVAVHAGTAPGVRATEPMLTSAKGGPVVANTGEELKINKIKSFLQLLQQLVEVTRRKVCRHLLQSDMTQRKRASVKNRVRVTGCTPEGVSLTLEP